MNPRTGEMHDVLVLGEETRGGRSPRRFSDPYVVLFQPDALRVALSTKLTGFELRLWLYLASQAPHDALDWEARLLDAAEAFGVGSKQVFAATRALIEAGLLVRPRRGYIAFNPEFAWRGLAELREIAVRQNPPQNREASPQQEKELFA